MVSTPLIEFMIRRREEKKLAIVVSITIERCFCLYCCVFGYVLFSVFCVI